MCAALLQALAGRAQRPTQPFREAIVFMLGGGNYLECESLRWVLVGFGAGADAEGSSVVALNRHRPTGK